MTQPQRRPGRRPPPVFREVHVSKAERVTPNLVRVVFAGDALDGFTPHGPAEHIKVFFPAAGQDRPLMPAWTDDGPVHAEGQPRPVSRTYTPRTWDADRRELTVDFVLHGEGLASRWAETVTVGQVVVVAGPGGPYPLDNDADSFVLAAESCALPALQTILEVLPPHARARVFVEVESAADEVELSSPASVEVTWFHRDGGDVAPGQRLEEALRALTLPSGSTRFWVGCEAGAMRSIRRHLLQERGLERASVYTHGYWKRGVANHPDHDMGDD